MRAFEWGLMGPRSSAAGITYAQAAERALERADGANIEQLARWWIREKLDAGMFVCDEWCGGAEDLPMEVGESEAVVSRTREIWTETIFAAFTEGMRAADDEAEGEG